MAGEKKGKAYEALIFLALEELAVAKKLSGPVHWNITPKGMTIEPDLMTGRNPDNPETVLLVSHCGSAKNSDMKMWRNLGELVEVKTVLPSMPRVYCLLFGVMKADWESIQQHAFDQFIWVRKATHAWADDLDVFISACVPAFPKGKDKQTDFMRHEVKNASAKAKSAYRNLRGLLETMHKAKSVALDKMWMDHRSRAIPAPPGARNTFLRRGTSKARIFPDLDTAYDLYSGKVVSSNSLPRYVFELGLASELTVNGKGIAKPTDREISNAVKLLDSKTFKDVTARLNSNKVDEYLVALRNLDRYGAIADYVTKEFARLSDPRKLAIIFRKLHKNPAAVSLPGKIPSAWPPNSVWLVGFLLDLVRAHQKSGNSYGIAQLGREVVAAGFGSIADLSSANQFGGGFGLSAWIDRKPRSGFRSDLIDGIAYVLAQHLRSMGSAGAKSALLGIKNSAAKSLIESKLVTYKMYEPLWELIELEVPSARKASLPSCFREAGASSGRSGHTGLARSARTLINWQSASDAGRDHKKKELCGRAIGLRYHWNGSSFIRRQGIQKLVLVLDGTWRQSDLKALLRSGWDEIFYPDEMDQLAKAIV